MDKKQIAEEEVKRALLLMKYDNRKTLTENVQDTEEVNEFVGALVKGASSLGARTLPWLRTAFSGAGTKISGAASQAVTKMGGAKNIAKDGAILVGTSLATTWVESALTSGGDSFQKTKTFFEGCDAMANELKPTLDSGKIRASAEKIYDAIEGVGTRLPNVKIALRDMTTVADICAMRKYYNDTYGDLYDDLDSDIDGNDFTTYVWSAIEPQITKAQADLSKVATDPDKSNTGNNTGGRGWRTDCSGTYSRSCMGEKIKEVQTCLGGLVPDGKFGPKTEAAVKAKLGTTTFTDEDVPKLCGKKEEKPDEDEDLEGEEPKKI